MTQNTQNGTNDQNDQNGTDREMVGYGVRKKPRPLESSLVALTLIDQAWKQCPIGIRMRLQAEFQDLKTKLQGEIQALENPDGPEVRVASSRRS